MYSFGIDLGGTNIAVGVVDTETGAIVKKGSVPTLASRHADEIMKDMAGLCKSLAEEMGLTIDDFAYAGIAAPGTIDNETGTVIYSNNIKMDMYPIADKLMEYSGIKKVYCENDANAAAYGEAAYGASKGTKNSVMITLGTGLGGGVIVDGKLVGSDEAVDDAVDMYSALADYQLALVTNADKLALAIKLRDRVAGDVNGDQYITASDYNAVVLSLLGYNNKYDADSLDVNLDGSVTSADSLALLQHMLGIASLY